MYVPIIVIIEPPPNIIVAYNLSPGSSHRSSGAYSRPQFPTKPSGNKNYRFNIITYVLWKPNNSRLLLVDTDPSTYYIYVCMYVWSIHMQVHSPAT